MQKINNKIKWKAFYLFLGGHVADVDWPLVELRHHEDCGHRLLLSVSDDGYLLGPLLKVLHTEPDMWVRVEWRLKAPTTLQDLCLWQITSFKQKKQQ